MTSYVATVFYPSYGGIRLRKAWNYNSSVGWAQNHLNYYKKDAVYAVFTDKACTKWTGKWLVCDETGAAQSRMDYAPGTYYVKEWQSPTGGVRDDTVYSVTVKADTYQYVTSVNSDPSVTNKATQNYVFDPIKRVALSMKKQAALGYEDRLDKNPDATLAGAQYTIYADEAMTTRIGVMTTDKNGNAAFSKDISLGTFYIKETKASEGYLLNEEVIKLTFYDKKDTDAYNSSTDRYKHYVHPLYCDKQVYNPATKKWSAKETTKLSLTSDRTNLSKSSRYAYSFTSKEVPEEVLEEPQMPVLPNTGGGAGGLFLTAVFLLWLYYLIETKGGR